MTANHKPGSGGAREGAGRKPGLQAPQSRGFWPDEQERHRLLGNKHSVRDRGWAMRGDDAQRGQGRVVHTFDGTGSAHLAIRPDGDRRVFPIGQAAAALAWVEQGPAEAPVPKTPVEARRQLSAADVSAFDLMLSERGFLRPGISYEEALAELARQIRESQEGETQ